MERFKVGDLVRHKSGGPRMVVVGVDNVYITCQYYNEITGHFDYLKVGSECLVGHV